MTREENWRRYREAVDSLCHVTDRELDEAAAEARIRFPIKSVAIDRIRAEINKETKPVGNYNRVYHRHNR